MPLFPLAPSAVWVQGYVIQPYLEGVERLSRAIQGISPHHFTNKFPLTTEERTIYAIQGTCLLIPLANAVLWIFMRMIFEAPKLYRY